MKEEEARTQLYDEKRVGVNLDSFHLRDRVAVVTGGSRGIGSAVVEILASLGARVAVNYLRDAVAADKVLEALREKGSQAISVQANVANPIEAQRLIATTIDVFKRIDILVCNAGVWEGSPVEKMTEELWDKTIDINLKGSWSVCRAVVPAMKEQRSGKIVMVTSTAGQRGEANFSNYAASKGGLIAFTKSLAAELAEWRINVNAVAPGWVDTDMTQGALSDYQHREAIAGTIPLGTIATPEEIAAPIAFLCTDWARHITGEVLNINGGSLLCGCT